jgi:hypothetical protein
VVEVGLIEVIVGTGLLMVNVAEFEVPPPGAGLTTVTDAVPAVATLAAGTAAVSCVEETKVVVKAEPFQLTFEVETKLVPLTVKVNAPLPAVVEVGLIELMFGTGLLIVNVCELDTGPVEFFTVTETVPAVATFAAGTVAVICPELPNVVARSDPPHITFEVESKPLPFTVKVKPAAPAKHEFGLIEDIEGAANALLIADSKRTNVKIRFMDLP